jgi:hypothetical protein
MEKYYTYAYLREDKTPYYIGKGKGNRAYKRNKGEINPPKDKSRILILKENLTEEEAFKHEIYMIAVFGRKDLGTGILRNKTDGGDGASGAVRSEETRRKIGEKSKGRKHSEETRKRMSEANKGKILSEEHRKKLGEKCKGWKHSEETRKRMSEALKGRIISEKTRKRMSEAHRGKSHSKETVEKRSAKKSCWWKLTFINGNEMIVHNLNKWAKENGYLLSSLSLISSGYYKRHKDIVAVVKLSQGDLKTDFFSDIIIS